MTKLLWGISQIEKADYKEAQKELNKRASVRLAGIECRECDYTTYEFHISCPNFGEPR